MIFKAALLAASLLLQAILVFGQTPGPAERLPATLLDITPPSSRVEGKPGQMRIIDRSCRQFPTDQQLRRRIVDTAVQEWGYFGFSVNDMTNLDPPDPEERSTIRRRFPRLSEAEAGRVAPSIGGYWSAAPDSSWILERQNRYWQSQGLSSRWRDPWSAAFISWVMCESGVGDSRQFQRAIAHHSYIDQAIRARDGVDRQSLFIAYDPGEVEINPGDMLCRGSRPEYLTLAQRRAQMGVGARTHCDIVVKLDQSASRIMVIGGNVSGSVRMKLLPAGKHISGNFAPLPYSGRSIFAHLKLRVDPIESNALDSSPTLDAYN